MSWPMIAFIVLLFATLGGLYSFRAYAWGYMASGALLLATILVGLKAFSVI